jgi:hypothetical protein
MTKKESLLMLIRQDGRCVSPHNIICLECLLCGIGVCHTDKEPDTLYADRKEKALELYVERYGTLSDLVEVLL